MKRKILKTITWSEMILGIVLIVICSIYHVEWWFYIPTFLIFMDSFCKLMSIYIEKTSASAAHTLANYAKIFGILALISMIVLIVWVLFF